MQPVRKPWWQQATALVSLSAGGTITGFTFAPGTAASIASPASLPVHLTALEKAAQPAAGDDAMLRSAVVNVTNYYLQMAKTKSPAEMEAIIWQHDSVDGADHGESCAAFASMTLELAAQTVGQQSWVTGGGSYPWPLHQWADVRVDPNPDSLGITSVLQDAQAHGRWHPLGDGYQAQPGDWVLFDGHIEVVTSYANGVLHTVGGDSLPNFSVNAHDFSDPLSAQGVAGFVNNGSLASAGAAAPASAAAAPAASAPQPQRQGATPGKHEAAAAAAPAAAAVARPGQDAAIPGMPMTTASGRANARPSGGPASGRPASATAAASQPGQAGSPHSTAAPGSSSPGSAAQDVAAQGTAAQGTAAQDAAAQGTAAQSAAVIPGVPTASAPPAASARPTTPRTQAPAPEQATASPVPSATPQARHQSSSTSASTQGTSPQQAFINAVAPGAAAAQRRYGVPAAVTIAQAIDESGWGQSQLATRDNNLFGIKGTGPAGSDALPTQEYLNGQWVSQTAGFRVYSSIAESIDDHGKLLATSGYYGQAMANRNDPNAFANALTGVYATDPGYGQTLIGLMTRYSLYQYDAGTAAATPAGTPQATPAGTPQTAPSAATPSSAAPAATPSATGPGATAQATPAAPQTTPADIPGIGTPPATPSGAPQAAPPATPSGAPQTAPPATPATNSAGRPQTAPAATPQAVPTASAVATGPADIPGIAAPTATPAAAAQAAAAQVAPAGTERATPSSRTAPGSTPPGTPAPAAPRPGPATPSQRTRTAHPAAPASATTPSPAATPALTPHATRPPTAARKAPAAALPSGSRAVPRHAMAPTATPRAASPALTPRAATPAAGTFRTPPPSGPPRPVTSGSAFSGLKPGAAPRTKPAAAAPASPPSASAPAATPAAPTSGAQAPSPRGTAAPAAAAPSAAASGSAAIPGVPNAPAAPASTGGSARAASAPNGPAPSASTAPAGRPASSDSPAQDNLSDVRRPAGRSTTSTPTVTARLMAMTTRNPPRRNGPHGVRAHARYKHQIPQPVLNAFVTTARVPLIRAEPLYRDVASDSGIRWELLAACDWMQCQAHPRYSPVHGEKLRTVNADGTVYRTRSEALAQCATDLAEFSAAVYQIDLAAAENLSVRDLANVFAAFRWGALLRLHHTSALEFPYSVAGLTAQHMNMRWPDIDEPNAPDKPGARFRRPFGAVPIVLGLGYPATV